MINAEFYNRCITSLEKSYAAMREVSPSDKDQYGASRSACVKEFEITLEQSKKLLVECLKKISAGSISAKITFNGAIERAVQHNLISQEEADRWLEYRESRNNTAHEYGAEYAEAILHLLPDFMRDVKVLQKAMEERLND